MVPASVALGVRVSATDWVEGGWDLEQTTAFADALKARGCDFIDVQRRRVAAAEDPGRAELPVPFAAEIKRRVGMPTIAVGLITEAAQAEEIVASGQADMVLARGMLRPALALACAAQLGGQVDAPRQYWRSQPREHKALFGETRFGQR